MSHILDTNACVALINGKPPSVRAQFVRALGAGATFFVPSIVAFELWCGVGKSVRQEFNRQRLEAFFAGPLALLPFDAQDARAAGAVRAALEAAGKPIGADDVLIAGQALRRQFTQVTANVREFGRVKALAWEDWARL